MPAKPAEPDIHPYGCGDAGELVCFTQADALALIHWIHDSIEIELAVEACNNVERTAPDAGV